MLIRFTFVIALFLCFAGIPVNAQVVSPDEIAVKETIGKLFRGMELGDSAMVRAAFAEEVTMATSRRDKENNPLLTRESSLAAFLKAVGTPHTEVWYEEIWNIHVQLDGDLAQVWCDYAFYAGNRFSHCGVDAFQLHRGKQGWKIFHLADTRRNNGCVIPEGIQNKHK